MYFLERIKLSEKMSEIKYLSIVVPTYRDREGLLELINSITISPHVEIIVIDDFSPDWENTLSVLSHLDREVIFRSNKVNSGAGYSRNRGLELASGKWIMFADSDDIFLPGAIDTLLKAISLVSRSVDIIYFRPVALTDKGQISTRVNLYQNIFDNFQLTNNDAQIRVRWFPPWSKLIRAEKLKNSGIKFDEVSASNDINFSVKIGIAANQISIARQPVYCVTDRSNSLTKSQNPIHLESRLLALLRYNEFLMRAESKYRLYAFAWGLPLRILARRLNMKNLKLLVKAYFNYFKCCLSNKCRS